MRRDLRPFAAVLFAAAVASAPSRAAAGPCPPEMPGGCNGFLRGKRLALTAVLGTGTDASPIRSVGVTPDGKTGYGLREDGALDAWDLATGALRRVAIARFIALDPGGRWAVAGQPRKDVPDRMWSETGSGLELWDLASRRRVAVATAEWEQPLRFVFSPRTLVSGYLGDDALGLILDATTGKGRLPNMTFCAGVAVVTPDGKQAICGGAFEDARHQGVLVWDLASMKVVREMPARAQDGGGQVIGIALSPDGKKALVMFVEPRSDAHRSIIWTLATGQVDKGPSFEVPVAAVLRWSSDGQKLISFGPEGYPGVTLYPGNNAKPIDLGGRREGPHDAVFLPDGKQILTGGDGKGVMRLVNAADGRALRASRELTSHESEVLNLSVSRDGTRLMSYGKDGSLKLWDLQNNRFLRAIALDPRAERAGGLMTSDGAYAVASLKGLSVIKLPEGTQRQPLVADRNIQLHAISPDGTLALAGPTLWEIPSGREVWSEWAANGGAAAFSADQRRIYVTTTNKALVNVFDASSGVVQKTLGPTGGVAQSPGQALAVDPKEGFVIVAPGGYDRDVRVEGEHDVVVRLDLPSGRAAWKIAVRSYVRQLAVSPDGCCFVATGALHFTRGGNDLLKRFPAVIELRAAADGSVIDELDLGSAGLTPYAATFTPDGRTLIVGSDQGPILRFALATP
ncbi:MAG TPA: hypothetical protein VKQ32_08780 [Polyangia bacterium]|nr:hypothetical protein [Polyangia bacterium]